MKIRRYITQSSPLKSREDFRDSQKPSTMKTRLYNTRSSSLKSREDFRVSQKSSTMKTRRYNKRSSSSISSLKSRKREENTSDQTIPFDLVIVILTRVPAKSIARFHCLSKLYASTLRIPNFTDSFFTISSSRPRLLFTVLKEGKMFFSSPQPQNPSPITTYFHMSFPINYPSQVSRPVKGLVCGLNQRTTKGGIVTTPLICNPSTGQFLHLPRVKTRRRGVVSYLGYDPSEKQLKVLCMTVSYVGPSFSEEHQVLTLETGKKLSWRMIKCDIPHTPVTMEYRDRHDVYDGICINGVFYYLALVSWKEYCTGFPNIVCFDIKSEKFSFIKRAHEGMTITMGGKIGSTLINYKGKLAKLQPNIDTGIQLWVLEDAVKHEWLSYIYVLPHPWKDIVAETNIYFVETTGRGEIVLLPNSLSDSFYLLYYDTETNTITKVGIQGMEDFQPHKAYTFFDHVENVKLMKFF